MKKQPKLTELTRQNLLEAFWSLYSNQGLESITVKQICTKAGYNRGTFYEYFRNIHECLEAIETQALPGLEELPPLNLAPSSIPDVFEPFFSLYQHKYRYYAVLLGEHGDPGFQRRLIDSIKRLVLPRYTAQSSTRSYTPTGTRTELVTDHDELELLLEFVLSGMIAVLRFGYQPEHTHKPEKLMAHMYSILSVPLLDKFKDLLEKSR